MNTESFKLRTHKFKSLSKIMREIIGNTKESEKGFKRNCRSYLLQETPRYKTTAKTKETLIKKVLICCVA